MPGLGGFAALGGRRTARGRFAGPSWVMIAALPRGCVAFLCA